MRPTKFGQYTAVSGKLSTGDSRSAYVTGPSGDGTIRPIASFWTLEQAIAWAEAHADDDARAEMDAGAECAYDPDEDRAP